MTETAPPYDVLFLDRSQNQFQPLPTPNDIDGSEILLHEATGCRLLQKQGFVVKFGVHVHPIEGHNMLYVAKLTTVPVPKPYAIYQHRKQQKVITYIVMQYVAGTTLVDLWGGLDYARKTAIAMTLRTYFDQLRQLPHPGYFGNIEGGLPLDGIFSATRGATEIKTHFATEEEFIEGIIQMHSLDTGERMAPKTRYYRHVLPTVLRSSSPPVFTHNDFQRKNIMVQPDGTLVIIDWEFASWYPTYWEYSTATFANGGWNDDWHDYVRLVLDEYPNQSLWLSGIRLEMWG
ncbi:Phosphotransferase enzyme family protein [Colletotrichum higginsianum IMI 349063]|uniref:Phosphotransferase enzyme family protein n=2 Tax=Colletotrichum higginsianum TaxID=80884 RepID=A0A1B7YLM6_COLHI|nr:Phosphotransferase enzyme family protein [Colletotrichum higginsianum IMI 349063]OBR12949.1 Phosphotransferase enzyme family protein [Colletotrichum higginsianum IMI 349063]